MDVTVVSLNGTCTGVGPSYSAIDCDTASSISYDSCSAASPCGQVTLPTAGTVTQDSYWTKSVNDIYYNDGKVFIGQISGTYTLDVDGDINITTGNDYLINGVALSLDDITDGTSYERVAANQLSSGIYIDATTSTKGIASFASDNFTVSSGAVSITNDTNWDAAYTHVSSTGEDHTYINQNVTTTGTPTFTSITVGNTGLTVGASIPFSDSSGTLTLQNIDALDATSEATIEAAIDTLANLTSIGSSTGLVKATAGTLSYITDSSTNWDTAYTHSQVTSANPHTVTFIELTGTPVSYTANKWLKVNAGGTALEYTDPSGVQIEYSASGTGNPITHAGEWTATFIDGTHDYMIVSLDAGTTWSAAMTFIGSDGAAGTAGVGISNAVINGSDELVLTYTDASSTNLGVVVGADGTNGSDGDTYLDAAGTGSVNLTTLAVGASQAVTTSASTFSYSVNQLVSVVSDASNYFIGTVVTYSSTTLTLNVVKVKGSGTIVGFTINLAGGVYQEDAGTSSTYILSLVAGTGTVASKIAGATVPSGWSLTVGATADDLRITHSLSEVCYSAEVQYVDGTEQIRLVGDAAYTKLTNETSSTYTELTSFFVGTYVAKVYLSFI